MADDPKLGMSQVETIGDNGGPKVPFVPPAGVRQLSAEERKHIEKRMLRKLDLRLLSTVGKGQSLLSMSRTWLTQELC